MWQAQAARWAVAGSRVFQAHSSYDAFAAVAAAAPQMVRQLVAADDCRMALK